VSSVVLWGPAERDLAARIVEAVGERCTLAPPTTLPEMMGLISCFAAFVGNDTGAMHMAWLQGVPTAAFVGPKPPRTVAPLAPVPSQVLRADEHYVEGVRASRQLADIVTAVPVGEAFEAVVALLRAAAKREGGRVGQHVA
jgi:ADP-heptose:LPS heptosyltransferase